jgi:Sec-independent protein translocase protein TatA
LGPKLPELGKALGDGIRGFKNAMKEQDSGADVVDAPATTTKED